MAGRGVTRVLIHDGARRVLHDFGPRAEEKHARPGQQVHAAAPGEELLHAVDDVDAAVAASAAHGFVPLAPPVAINAGPNRGRKVVYLRDADGVTVEFIESA